MTIGVDLETTNALKDAQDIIQERGNTLILNSMEESDLNRDIYNSIQKKVVAEEYTFFAFPIVYSPNRFQLEKAGIKEKVNVIVTLATLDFTENEVSYKDIDNIRWEVILDEEVYLIEDKNKINHFNSTFLNIVFGLVKK